MVLFMSTFHKHQTRKKTYLQLKGIWVRKQNARVVFLDLLRDSSRQLWSELLNPAAGTTESCPPKRKSNSTAKFCGRNFFRFIRSWHPPHLQLLPSPGGLEESPGSFYKDECLCPAVSLSPDSDWTGLGWGLGAGDFFKCCPGNSTVWPGLRSPR